MEPSHRKPFQGKGEANSSPWLGEVFIGHFWVRSFLCLWEISEWDGFPLDLQGKQQTWELKGQLQNEADPAEVRAVGQKETESRCL